MNTSLYPLSPQQEKIRKQWLIAAICTCFLYPLLIFAILALMTEDTTVSTSELYASLLHIFAGLIIFSLFYHFAYKKRGTGLLTWTMIMGPISILKNIDKDILIHLDAGTSIDLLIYLSLYAWWYVMALKLRRVNKEIQLQVFQSSSAYLEAQELVCSSTSLEDLQFKFHESIREQPSGFANALRPIYHSKKAELENQGV